MDAFHEISIDEEDLKNFRYFEMSTRVMGLCYDLRHAYMGDREVELVDNNMDGNKMKWHSMIAPENNVYYKCNCLYPEMFFIVLALNELVKLRIMELTKTKYIYKEALAGKVIWDDTIATIRSFQAEFSKCVKGTIKETSFTRWINFMNKDYLFIRGIAEQYVDVLNIKYIKMTAEKRLKSLTTIARKIAEYEYDEEHEKIKEAVEKAAKEYGCSQGEISLHGIEYPEDIKW